MTGVVEFGFGHGGVPIFNEHTDWVTVTAGSSLVHNGPARVAAISLNTLTASAGTRVAVTVYDGSSSNGVILKTISANSSWAPDDIMSLPYPRCGTGLFVDFAGETSGVTGVTLFYLKEKA